MPLDVATIVAVIGALVVLAHFFRWLFSLTAIPDGLLLMGIGLVASAIGLASPESFGGTGTVLLTITLVLMLFESGTRLSVVSIRDELWRALVLTVVVFLLTMAGVSLTVLLLTDLSLLLSLIIGAIVGGTSSAVVIPFLDRMQVGASSKTLLTLESAVSDVLVIVVTIALLKAAVGGEATAVSVSLLIIASFLYAGLVGVVTGLMWSLLLDRVRNIRNSIFITLAFLFILYGLVEKLGFSGPITALTFGITLGNIGALNDFLSNRHQFLSWIIRPTELSRRERAFFGETVFLLETFFFVFVGLSISLTNVSLLLTGLVVVGALLVTRLLAVRLVSSRIPPDDAGLMAVLIPKGLASAVLATLVVQSGVPDGVVAQELVYSIILWSIVVTSILIFLLSKTKLGDIYGSLAGSQVAEPLPLPDARITGSGDHSARPAAPAAGSADQAGNHPPGGDNSGLSQGSSSQA